MDEKKKSHLEDIIAWILLIGIIAFSVARTTMTNIELEKAQGDLKDTQQNIKTSSACTQQFLGQGLVSLEENSKYNTSQSEANARLQRVQQFFLEAVVSDDPLRQAEADQRLEEYFFALKEYNRIIGLRKGKEEEFPFPTVEQYVACLEGITDPPKDPPKPTETPRSTATTTPTE